MLLIIVWGQPVLLWMPDCFFFFPLKHEKLGIVADRKNAFFPFNLKRGESHDFFLKDAIALFDFFLNSWVPCSFPI